MKRTERIISLTKTLTDNPNKLYSLQYFVEKYDAAKSSISEDIKLACDAIKLSGSGYLETISGARGGVMFIPYISDEEIKDAQDELIKRLRNPERFLGGNFLYTSDIFYDHNMVKKMAMIFARKYAKCGITTVLTIETKGIPLAYKVAEILNVPLVIVRREAKVSEGSTVSINYFSGSDDRIQKMSMSKRALVPGSKILIIDDYMRGGGSIVGMHEIAKEFNSEIVGVGVALVSAKPEKKKVKDYSSILVVGEYSQDTNEIEITPSDSIF